MVIRAFTSLTVRAFNSSISLVLMVEMGGMESGSNCLALHSAFLILGSAPVSNLGVGPWPSLS